MARFEQYVDNRPAEQERERHSAHADEVAEHARAQNAHRIAVDLCIQAVVGGSAVYGEKEKE